MATFFLFPLSLFPCLCLCLACLVLALIKCLSEQPVVTHGMMEMIVTKLLKACTALLLVPLSVLTFYITQNDTAVSARSNLCSDFLMCNTKSHSYYAARDHANTAHTVLVLLQNRDEIRILHGFILLT